MQQGSPLPLAVTFDPETKNPTLRRIKRAWQSKITDSLVEVRTDKGHAIKCTPDHEFYAYGGQVKIQASELKSGQRLCKIGSGKAHDRAYCDSSKNRV